MIFTPSSLDVPSLAFRLLFEGEVSELGVLREFRVVREDHGAYESGTVASLSAASGYYRTSLQDIRVYRKIM